MVGDDPQTKLQPDPAIADIDPATAGSHGAPIEAPPDVSPPAKKCDSGRRRPSHSYGEGSWLVKHHSQQRLVAAQKHQQEQRRASGSKVKRLSSARFSSRSLLGPGIDFSSRGLEVSGHSSSKHKDEDISPRLSVAVADPSLTDGSATSDGLCAAEPGAIVPVEETTDGGRRERESTVTFSTCTVRYYDTILGDNPFCTSGPSLSIGWNYDPSYTDSDIPVDVFEEVRSPHRKSEWDLALSRAERETRLLDRGFDRASIAAAVRESNRVKSQRRRTLLNLPVAGAEEFAESMRKSAKRYVFLRKSSDHLYKEWVALSKKGAIQESSMLNSAPVAVMPAEPSASSAQELRSSATGHRDSNCQQEQEEMETVAEGSLLRKRKSAAASLVSSFFRSSSLQDEDQANSNAAVSGPLFDPNRPHFGVSVVQSSVRASFLSFSNEGSEIEEDNDEDAAAMPFAIVDEENEEDDAVTPFAIVDLVFPGSPAHDAGLRRGDSLVKLGSITHENHNHLIAVAELGVFASAEEKSIPMVVLRNGTASILSIRPREWNGRGLFGFLLRSVGSHAAGKKESDSVSPLTPSAATNCSLEDDDDDDEKKAEANSSFHKTMKWTDDVIQETKSDMKQLGSGGDSDLEDLLKSPGHTGDAELEEGSDAIAELDAMLSAADKELADLMAE